MITVPKRPMRNIIEDAGISDRRLVNIGIEPPKNATTRAIPIPINFVSYFWPSSSSSLLSFLALSDIATMDTKQMIMPTTMFRFNFSLLIK